MKTRIYANFQASSFPMIQLILFLIPLVAAQFYPLTKNGLVPKDIKPYEHGQSMFMDCISRHIDNGEHKMDSQDRIIYVPFPICKETGLPLMFKYDVNEDFNCTITFDDELYHLFQIYIHEDAPFSCRIPLSTEQNYMEQGGAYIPLTFNFRGEIHESHLDIDPSLNVFFIKPRQNEINTLISAAAFGASTNATRVVIGEEFTINLAARWFDNLNVFGSQTAGYKNRNGLPYVDGFYNFPVNILPISYTSFVGYLVLVAMVSGMISLAISYNVITTRISKNRYLTLDHEAGISKRD